MTLTDPSRNDRWLTRIRLQFLAGGFLGGWVLAAGLEFFRWEGITRLPGWEVRWAAAFLAVWTLLSPGTAGSILTALRNHFRFSRDAPPPKLLLPPWGLAALGAAGGALWWELPGTFFMTAAFLIGFRSVLRRLPPGERTSLSRLISLALATRLLFIFVYYPLASFMGWTAAWLTLDVPPVLVPVLFGDGVDALSLSRAWALYWRGDWVSPAEFAEIANPDRSLFSIHGDVRHLLPPALLFFVFGVEMIGARVLSSVATVCAAVIAYFTLRGRFGVRAAWCAAALLAFWPTLFSWSLDALKEPYFLLLLIASAWFTERFSREGGWRPMAASLVMLGLALSVRTRWFPPIVFTAVICLGGWVIRKALHRFSRVRQAACGALVLGLLIGGVFAWPAGRRLVYYYSHQSVSAQRSFALHYGNGYKVWPAEYYTRSTNDFPIIFKWRDAAWANLKNLGHVMFEPFPRWWGGRGWKGAAFFLLAVPWWIVVGLAGVGGGVIAFRKDGMGWIYLVYTSVTLAFLATFSGNVGTLIRHRDSVSPILLMIAAVGVSAVWERLRPGESRG